MKENTVKISLEDYNELRDFHTKLNDGFVYTSYFNDYGDTYKNYITLDQAFGQRAVHLDFVQNKIKGLRKDVKNLKEMNYFQFRKWKKEQR